MERATQNVINIEIERSRRGSSTRPAINPPSPPPPPPPSRIWFKPMVFRLIFIATLRRRRVSLFIHSLNVIPASILNPSYRNIKILAEEADFLIEGKKEKERSTILSLNNEYSYL